MRVEGGHCQGLLPHPRRVPRVRGGLRRAEPLQATLFGGPQGFMANVLPQTRIKRFRPQGDILIHQVFQAMHDFPPSRIRRDMSG